MKNTLLFGLFSFLLLQGCNDDDPDLSPDERLTLETNNWILNEMNAVYFWTDEIPSGISKSQDPSAYFEQLLFRDDRFSVIVPNYNELINSLNGIELEAGYEFSLVQTENDEVRAIVTYVKPSSPAAAANIKRGDVISKVNGQTLTLNNYQAVVPEIFNNHAITFSRYDTNEGAYIEQPEAQLSAIQYSENPNFLDTVYTVDSRKIGYYVYNFFSNGSTGDDYDSEVEQIFTNFKAENLTDLVIDLRYNGGGSIVSATNLASHIAPGVTANDIFYRNQWNDTYQEFWASNPEYESQLRGFFTAENANLGNDLNATVYIITGRGTASASELLINGLDPYMNVTIIGETTIGKNVGSIPIEDTENPDNEYGMLPIVIQVANSDGYSGYQNGFTPLGDNFIEELRLLPLRPLGDLEEPLLARAIELITGSSPTGRRYETTNDVTNLGSSLNRHLRSNKMVLLPENLD